MTDHELEILLADLESDRAERKSSLAEPDKIRQAVCAFANDLPRHEAPGVVFVGVRDDGTPSGLPITDQILLDLAAMRSDGNIVPIPSLVVQKRSLQGTDLAVVIVEPADAPPVRYKGRVWIRVGPRRDLATPEDERRLTERRRSKDIPFDLSPLRDAALPDLDLELFSKIYLPSAVAADVLDQNQRDTRQQLSSLRFISTAEPARPTVVGILVAGADPTRFLPGAYVQFLRIDGLELTDAIKDSKEVTGPIPDLLRRLEELIRLNISTASDPFSKPVELRTPDYPFAAIWQLVINAVLHRAYEGTNAPVRITWFSDRVEIQSPGGPFGQVTRETFGNPGIADYRNPHLAEALKNLGYVQKFGVGIQIARKELERNGNPPLEFVVEAAHILAVVRRRA
jgi:ATP-dependent DNA helicase RecG